MLKPGLSVWKELDKHQVLFAGMFQDRQVKQPPDLHGLEQQRFIPYLYARSSVGDQGSSALCGHSGTQAEGGFCWIHASPVSIAMMESTVTCA